jgi:hypothetical protein
LREPYRIGVGALVGVPILVGAAFAELTRRLGASAIVRGAVAAILVVATFACTRLEDGTMPWGRPYPIAAVTRPAAIAAALRRPGGPVIELPVGGPFVDELETHARAMFESIDHWRPLVNGYGGFYPADFPERMRLAARLPAADAVRRLREETNFTNVIVHRGTTDDPTFARWEELARRGGTGALRFVLRDGDDLLFEVSDDIDRPPEHDHAQ